MCQYVLVKHLLCDHVGKDAVYCPLTKMGFKELGPVIWEGHIACEAWEDRRRDEKEYKQDTVCWECNAKRSGEITKETEAESVLEIMRTELEDENMMDAREGGEAQGVRFGVEEEEVTMEKILEILREEGVDDETIVARAERLRGF